MKLLDVLRRKFGGDAVTGTAQVAAAAAGDDSHLDSARIVHATTLPAHQLIAVASDQGLGEAMVERLFRAYFTDALNIADPTTLTDLATQVGVRLDGVPDGGACAVREGLRTVRSRGVTTIPTFFHAARPPLTGAGS